jgi:hypothetical protein
MLRLPQELLGRVAEELELNDIKGSRPVCWSLNAAASAKVQAVRVEPAAAPPPASVWRAFGSATRLVVGWGHQTEVSMDNGGAAETMEAQKAAALVELVSSAPQRITSITLRPSCTLVQLSDADSAALAAALRQRKLQQLHCAMMISQAAADDILASQEQLQQLSLACRPPHIAVCTWRPKPAAAGSLQSLSLTYDWPGDVDITGLALDPDAAPGSCAWGTLQHLSIKSPDLRRTTSLAQLSSSITSLALPYFNLAASDLQHLQRLPRLTKLGLFSVAQPAWRALGKLEQLQSLDAHDVAPDTSVQLAALERLTCNVLLLAPDAQPGSLAAALPALQALDVRLFRQFPAIIRALQGHRLLAAVAILAGSPEADAWPEGGLSLLPALRKFSIDSGPLAWLGPLLEDLAGCAGLDEARVGSALLPGQTGSPALPAGALQAMAARVAAGGMARLSSLQVSVPASAQRWTVADALPLVEALVKRGAGGAAAGAVTDVVLKLPLSTGSVRAAELRQVLQARGLRVDEFGGVFQVRGERSDGPRVHLHTDGQW